MTINPHFALGTALGLGASAAAVAAGMLFGFGLHVGGWLFTLATGVIVNVAATSRYSP